MPIMQWSDKLSVGVAQCDNEHKQLVAMLNELFDSMQAGHGKEALGTILGRLISYTKTHFANEERLLKQHNFAEFVAHKAEHDALAKQVLDVEAKFKAGATSALSMEVMNFLKNWLLKHIMGTDKHYGPFLQARGVR